MMNPPLTMFDLPHAHAEAVFALAQAKIVHKQVVAYQLDLSAVDALFAKVDVSRPPYMLKAQRSRWQEFYAGRCLAQGILAQHFQQMQAVTSLQQPLPMWPQGILGSISHSKAHLMVAVTTHMQFLGIDLEHWVDVDFAQDSAPLILTESDLNLWQNSNMIQHLSFCQYVTLIFSIKESLYKAVYPQARQYIDFLDASVHHIDPETQRIQMTFCAEIQQRYALQRLYEGGWQMQDTYIQTWIAQ